MELFEELEKTDKKFDNILGLYINNDEKMSYLIYMANQKKENLKQLNHEVAYYFELMISLITDYSRGVYKKIPIQTFFYLLSALTYFVFPKRTVFDKIPGVKIVKKIGLIKLVVHSFKNDLIKYATWKKHHENTVEV